VEETAFEWKNPLLSLTPAYTRRDPVAWFCSHRHDGAGRNEPYEYCYLYRYALDIPPGAKTLTLPDNPAVKIMAITAANDPDPAFRPAQPLYDELLGHPSAEFDGWLPEQ
jgi:alpha-mannosidase